MTHDKGLPHDQMMPLPITRRILAPVDFSELSREAVAVADRMAMERDAELTLFHVHPVVQTVFLDATYTEPAERIAESIAALEDKLSRWSQGLTTPKDRLSLRVSVGNPLEAIVRESAEHGIMVISTHGRSGLSHLLLGSVAERVIRSAQCAVLVVKHQQNGGWAEASVASDAG